MKLVDIPKVLSMWQYSVWYNNITEYPWRREGKNILLIIDKVDKGADSKMYGSVGAFITTQTNIAKLLMLSRLWRWGNFQHSKHLEDSRIKTVFLFQEKYQTTQIHFC